MAMRAAPSAGSHRGRARPIRTAAAAPSPSHELRVKVPASAVAARPAVASPATRQVRRWVISPTAPETVANNKSWPANVM